MKQFNFWKDNEINQHHLKTEDELKQLFKDWLPTREIAWLNYYNSERIIRYFLTDKTGVSSVFEEREFDDMYWLLKPVYMDYMVEVRADGWKAGWPR